MTRIPSIEKTDDFIYRFETKRGTPLRGLENPHLLVVEEFVESAGSFHSIDITIFRDGQRANDVEFRGFEHIRQPNMTYLKFELRDEANLVDEHDYLFTIILRYLIS